MKKKSSRFLYFLEYRWIFLILFAIVSYVVFYYPIRKINAFRAEEKIVLFSAGGILKDEKFAEELRKEVPEILSVETYCYRPDERVLGSLYDAYGPKSDFLILSQQDMKDMEDVLEKYWINYREIKGVETSSFSFYEKDGKAYGLKISEGASSVWNQTNSFGDWISFQEGTYYLLCNKKSVNFEDLGKKNLSDHGISSLKFNLERYGK